MAIPFLGSNRTSAPGADVTLYMERRGFLWVSGGDKFFHTESFSLGVRRTVVRQWDEGLHMYGWRWLGERHGSELSFASAVMAFINAELAGWDV